MTTAREKLVDDFSAVLTEAEDLLKRASNETGDAREGPAFAGRGEAARRQAAAAGDRRARPSIARGVAARITDDYVHDNPWQAIGVAAAVGFVVGLLMTRR